MSTVVLLPIREQLQSEYTLVCAKGYSEYFDVGIVVQYGNQLTCFQVISVVKEMQFVEIVDEGRNGRKWRDRIQ